jgi:hypothetical protein
VVRRRVRSRNLVNEEATAHWGLSCQKQTSYGNKDTKFTFLLQNVLKNC